MLDKIPTLTLNQGEILNFVPTIPIDKKSLRQLIDNNNEYEDRSKHGFQCD